MIVLDASALMALIYDEDGADEVAQRTAGSLMSAVNLSEVLQKVTQRGITPVRLRGLLHDLEVGVVPFDDQMAEDAAALWRHTRHIGLSFADRACLALAQAVNGVAVTADRPWAKLNLPEIGVHVIRR